MISRESQFLEHPDEGKSQYRKEIVLIKHFL